MMPCAGPHRAGGLLDRLGDIGLPGRPGLDVGLDLHGLLSLEPAGHFAGMDLDPELLFEAEAGSLYPR
jgi:hypothetical protein